MNCHPISSRLHLLVVILPRHSGAVGARLVFYAIRNNARYPNPPIRGITSSFVCLYGIRGPKVDLYGALLGQFDSKAPSM